MLRGAAPVNGRAAQSTAPRVETVSAKEPGSSRAESEAGIRAQRSPLSGSLHELQAFHCKHCTNSTTLSRQRSSQPSVSELQRNPTTKMTNDPKELCSTELPKNSSLRTVSVILWTSLGGEGPW